METAIRSSRVMMEKQEKVLIVEDMRSLATLLAAMIQDKWGIESDIAVSLEQTQQFLQEDASHYFVAVVDLHLPDAPEGEAIDTVIQHKIPVLAFTGQYSESLREDILSKGVVDYTLKQGQGVEHVVNTVGRLHKNENTKVLVVDDSRVARNAIVNT
ncbi:MAG TPA: response regulator, partial [Pseudomonadales bacterium]|nr:response regulator [Pseudomonadales bacterium]